jgi:hypothetical protein
VINHDDTNDTTQVGLNHDGTKDTTEVGHQPRRHEGHDAGLCLNHGGTNDTTRVGNQPRRHEEYELKRVVIFVTSWFETVVVFVVRD